MKGVAEDEINISYNAIDNSLNLKNLFVFASSEQRYQLYDTFVFFILR